MACGPTAFQRSPTPMQPSTGRSLADLVFASCAITGKSLKKYGATTAPAVAPAAVCKNLRRDSFRPSFDMFSLTEKIFLLGSACQSTNLARCAPHRVLGL